VTAVISDESFWAMIALMLFWIVLSSSWADNTIFTVPEWKISRTVASFV